MQTVSLTWQHALELSAVVAAAGAALAVPRHRLVRFAGAFLREAAVIGALYGLWQLAGTVSLTSGVDARARGRWIAHAEHDVWLPSERSMQHLVLGHRYVVEVANLYYATMHFTMLFVFLIWLFVRHRDSYRPIRQVLAWTTLCCLAVQTLLPTAPPRMFHGIVDTGMRYGQSVYAGGFPADQLSAMPSVHVAWAVLIGWYAWRVSTSRWRLLGVAHAVITVTVVVITGNHWWLDGIVATALLALCAWAVFGARTAWRRAVVRRRGRTQTPTGGLSASEDSADLWTASSKA